MLAALTKAVGPPPDGPHRPCIVVHCGLGSQFSAHGRHGVCRIAPSPCAGQPGQGRPPRAGKLARCNGESALQAARA